MTHWKRALPAAALGGVALLGIACLPGGGPARPLDPTATPRTDVHAARTATLATATPTPSPTQLPVLPTLTSYVVKSGDYPTLIAENVGVPADQRDAWIREMLALNGVEATSLQIGQKLILPPYGDGTAPIVPRVSSDSAPPAGVLEPAATATSTPKPEGTAITGVPFAATPPFVAFAATATPTITPTPTATPTPIATPTIGPGQRAWLTSSDDAALYYYCDLDSGWTNIPAEKLLAFDSEQQLLAIWGRFRTKAPDSVC